MPTPNRQGGSTFFGKGSKPGPNDIIYRADVYGHCTSEKCAGSHRIAAYVVYGDGSTLVRCKTCNTVEPGVFIMLPGQEYNVGTRFGSLGEDEPPESGNWDPSNKRGHRSG